MRSSLDIYHHRDIYLPKGEALMRTQASDQQVWRPMGYDPQISMDLNAEVGGRVVLNHETCRKKCKVELFAAVYRAIL